MPRLKQSELDELLRDAERRGYAKALFASRPISSIPLHHDIQQNLDKRAWIHAEEESLRRIP